MELRSFVQVKQNFEVVEGRLIVLSNSTVSHLIHLLQLWNILEDDLSHCVRVSSSKVHFLRMLVYIPTITHIGACVWFMVACFHEGKLVIN